jgi:cytochrome b
MTLSALSLTGLLTLIGGIKTAVNVRIDLSMGEPARRIHDVLAVGLLALVAMHIAGTLAESVRSRENLISATCCTGGGASCPGQSEARRCRGRYSRGPHTEYDPH